MANFELLLLEAVARCQDGASMQELTDAKTTEANAQLEKELYDYWNTQMNIIMNGPNQDGKGGINGEMAKKHPDQNVITKLSKQFDLDNIEAQSAETSQDGMVQTTQNQTQADSTNLTTKIELGQTISQIAGATASLLASSKV
ncbi:MAG: hypothetical protein L0207_00035 [Chlamydiae bacterium]|nr:hypothetical protein [Chlamydiota bacterium]